MRKRENNIFGDTAMNYVGHRACARRASVGARKERKQVEMAELAKQKELAVGQERKHFHRATRNGEWLSAVPHHRNGTKFSREEFWDDFRPRYRLMP